jgi:hypothetical protein
MATNSFSVDKTVKYGRVILIEQDLVGEVNDTNEFTMELPAGSGHTLISAQFVTLAAGAAANTQVIRVERVKAGTATTAATFLGTTLNGAVADQVFQADAIDITPVAGIRPTEFASGDSIRFSIDWGAADTLTGKLTCLLSAN